MSKNWMRWLPAAVVPAVVVSAAIAIPAAAGAAPTLPEKSADEVLAMIADSADVAYSGTIEQRSDLGLPELPSSSLGSSTSATDALEFLSGTHTLRAFVGDHDSLRLQVLDDMGERNVVRNGNEVWLYDYSEKKAVNLTFPEGADADIDTPTGIAAHPEYTGPTTPAEAAERLVQAIEPSTTVTVGTATRVAGRSVYQLALDPKSADTLVDKVVLSVDSETGLALSVVVTARGQEQPAFSVGFSAVDFTAPDAALFEFNPPADATVVEKTIDPKSIESESRSREHGSTSDATDAAPAAPDAMTDAMPTVTGSGWDAVVTLPALAAGALAEGSTEGGADAAQLFGQLTTPVTGGRVLETALVTVLITDDGRIFAGAVPVERLQAAAGSLER